MSFIASMNPVAFKLGVFQVSSLHTQLGVLMEHDHSPTHSRSVKLKKPNSESPLRKDPSNASLHP